MASAGLGHQQVQTREGQQKQRAQGQQERPPVQTRDGKKLSSPAPRMQRPQRFHPKAANPQGKPSGSAASIWR